jgi:NADPH2:quinone reductase
VTVKAVVVHELGGPEVLKVEEWPTPTPTSGEVLVRITHAGVNYADIYQRSGPSPVPLPFVAGSEAVGEVAEVGDGVDGISAGDRVAWAMVPNGTYAEYASVPAQKVVPVPAGIDSEVAAAVMLQGMTAHYLCESTYRVGPGEDVLLHAGAGGVGLLLTQMIVARGARVFTTTSSQEKAELSLAAGASSVINYSEDDVAGEVRRLTDDRGVSVVYDGVGASTFQASLNSLRLRGMLVLFGAASGPVPPLDPQVLNAKGSLFLTRPNLAHYIRDRHELLARASAVFDLVEEGRLDVRVERSYPLAEAAQAHEDLAARRTTGKLLLVA